MASPIKFSQDTNDGLEYNVPDNFERNPEIIRAEMALLSTPAAQAYSVEAYNAIKNVQDQCAIDYKNLCAPVSPQVYTLSVPDIFNHLDMVFGHRSLSENNEEAFESKGAKLVKTMQSYYKPAVGQNLQKPEKKVWTTSKKNLRTGGRSLKGKGKKEKEEKKEKAAEVKSESVATASADVAIAPEALPSKPLLGRTAGNVHLSPGPMVKKLDPQTLSKLKQNAAVVPLAEDAAPKMMNVAPVPVSHKIVHDADGQLVASTEAQAVAQNNNKPPLRGVGDAHAAHPPQMFQQGEVNGRVPGPPPRPDGNGPPPRPAGPRPPRPSDYDGHGPPPRPDGNGPLRPEGQRPPRPSDFDGRGPPPRPNDPHGPPPPRGGPPPAGGKPFDGPPGGDHHGEKPKGPPHDKPDSSEVKEHPPKETKQQEKKDKEVKDAAKAGTMAEKDIAAAKTTTASSTTATTNTVTTTATAEDTPKELTKGAGGRPNGFVPSLAKDKDNTDTIAATSTVPAANAATTTTETVAATAPAAPKSIRDLFMINGPLSAMAKKNDAAVSTAPYALPIVGNALPRDLPSATNNVISSDADLVPHAGDGLFHFMSFKTFSLLGDDGSSSDSDGDSDSDGEGESDSAPRAGHQPCKKSLEASSAPGSLGAAPSAGVFRLMHKPDNKPLALHSVDWLHDHGHGDWHGDDDADDHHKGHRDDHGPGKNHDHEGNDHKGPPPPRAGSPPPPPPPPPHEDIYFSGALGYGADGDMCMYAHSDELSQPCVDSVQALYQLRDQYWHESQPPNHCHFVGFLLLGLVAVWGVRRWMWRGRIKKVRNFLSVLHANPALKATVEAETGLKVPEVRCGGLRSRHGAITASAVHSSDACSAEGEEERPKYSCCARLCINIAWFVGLFMLSFFLAVSALEDTGRIIHWLDHRSGADIPRDDSEEHPGVTVFGALTILFIVCLVKITITCLCIKAAGCVYKYFTRGGNGNNNNASTSNGSTVVNATAHGDYEALPSPTDGPSAPPGSPMNKKPATTRYTAVNANGPALSTNALVVPTHVPRIWGRWSTPSASSGFFSARRSNGYSPVSGHDQDNDTEMVTVSAPVTTQAQVQQQYVLVPVTATPLSSINMV